MTTKFPIVAVTGSSGAGTSGTRPVFETLFMRHGLTAAFVEGDSFHSYERAQMQTVLDRARIRGENFSHFGPAANLWDRLETLFREFGEKGTGLARRYLHTEAEARAAGQAVGTFTPWTRIAPGTQALFYEGLHGGIVTDEHDVASHVDLLIGLTPIVNLEWIQKIRRDTQSRGYEAEEVTRTILRRMPDYARYIAPQFSRTDVNFQRVPLVDTSNPFVLQDIPNDEESLLVVHLNPESRVGDNIDALLAGLPGAFRSRPDTFVVPGGRMGEVMARVLGPAIATLAAARA